METFLILIPCLLVTAALIYVWYLACREFARIADAKGFAGSYYFNFCFWMGLIGMLMVIALPDRKGTAGASGPKHSDESAPVPVAFSDNRRMSSAVAPAVVRAAAAARAAAPAPVSSSSDWRCTCGTGNSMNAALCGGCREKWHCSCGRLNERQEKKCTRCGAWRCSCGATNPASKGTCESCGETKPR